MRSITNFIIKAALLPAAENNEDSVPNLTCLGHVFWVTMKGPGEMSLTKVIQRSWYWGNYYFLSNFDNSSCCDSTLPRNHSWDLLVLCGTCNSTYNWTYTVMESNGCYNIWQVNSKYCKVQMFTEYIHSNIESLNQTLKFSFVLNF